jgi:hypothetical protein
MGDQPGASGVELVRHGRLHACQAEPGPQRRRDLHFVLALRSQVSSSASATSKLASVERAQKFGRLCGDWARVAALMWTRRLQVPKANATALSVPKHIPPADFQQLFTIRRHRRTFSGGAFVSARRREPYGRVGRRLGVGNSRCQCAIFSLRFSDKMRHLLRMLGQFSMGVLRARWGCSSSSRGDARRGGPAGEAVGASTSDVEGGGGYHPPSIPQQGPILTPRATLAAAAYRGAGSCRPGGNRPRRGGAGGRPAPRRAPCRGARDPTRSGFCWK